MALTLGPIVGAVTDKTAKIWFRSNAQGTFKCRIFKDQAMQKEVPADPAEKDGYTTTVKVEGLEPNTVYRYEIIDPQGVKTGPLTFQTFPTSDDQRGFTFAFVSCHDPFVYDDAKEGYGMWERMAKVFDEKRQEGKDVRFLLMIGDQVYADDCYKKVSRGEQPAVEGYREVYQQYWGHASVMKILGRYPTYMIWDDHEIRDGWGSQDGDSEEHTIFKAARKVYWEFQHGHNPMNFGPEAQHYAFGFGEVGFLVLDLRGHRKLSREDRPLLGAQQWEDTKDWLTKQNFRVLFIVCSVPPVHVPPSGADLLGVFPSFKDHWSYRRLRPEQREMVRLLFKVANDKDQQIVVLGGNVHVGTTAKIQSRTSDRVIYQFTSSPVANERVNWLTYAVIRAMGSKVKIDEEISGRILERFRKRNFSLVHVNYDSPTGKYRTFLELYLEGMQGPYTPPI